MEVVTVSSSLSTKDESVHSIAVVALQAEREGKGVKRPKPAGLRGA
jgi:hypothetical protein